jgi:hypothetical protein
MIAKIIGWLILVLGAIGVFQSLLGSWNMYDRKKDPDTHISHHEKLRLKNTWLLSIALLVLAGLIIFLG